MRGQTLCFSALLYACALACAPPVVPPNPDASDAAPMTEAAPAPPPGSLACVSACAALRAAGCVVTSDCAATLTSKTAGHLFRNQRTAAWLTCEDVAAAKTVADVQALGQPCGP